jgi:uncharacterized protein (TIGR02466 family)
MDIIPIFPSLIFHLKIPVPTDLKNYCLKLKETDEGVKYSNRGGWQSSPYLHNDSFFVENYLNYFASEITKHNSIPPWQMNACWVNVNYKSHYNILHDHPKCDYSLVWYISASENCGNIIFENPNCYSQCGSLTHVDSNISKTFNFYPDYRFIPKEGNCYLFPSNLKHLVEENNSNEVRISMSANIDFIDKQR